MRLTLWQRDVPTKRRVHPSVVLGGCGPRHGESPGYYGRGKWLSPDTTICVLYCNTELRWLYPVYRSFLWKTQLSGRRCIPELCMLCNWVRGGEIEKVENSPRIVTMGEPEDPWQAAQEWMVMRRPHLTHTYLQVSSQRVIVMRKM